MNNMENFGSDSMNRMPGMNGQPLERQGMPPLTQADLDAMQAYQAAYPEIFYKLQPYIMMMCDQMDSFGTAMPNQEMIEQMSDNIYEDLLRMYPDLADYVRSHDNAMPEEEDAVEAYYLRRISPGRSPQAPVPTQGPAEGSDSNPAAFGARPPQKKVFLLTVGSHHQRRTFKRVSLSLA